MMEINAAHEHPATSLAKFFAAHAEDYRNMVNAPCNTTNSERRDALNAETLELHAMHLRGATIGACAKRAGITNAAMSGRFRRRGLEVLYHAGGSRKTN